MPIRVTFAGQVGIDVDGFAVDLTGLGRVGRLFFAYLTSERHRPVPKGELAEILWGDDELPASWEPMLRGNASKLRAAFAAVGVGPEVVISAFGAYQVQLPPEAVVDVEEADANVQLSLAALAAGNADDAARAAAAARAVAAKGFLPGWSGIWVERRQAEVGELHLRALEALARADCRRSMWSEAVRAADEAVAIEPFRESAVQALMAAHRGAGNVGEALRAYERCRRTLAEELGVSPSPATEAAYLSLLGDEPAVAVDVPLELPAALAPTSGGFLVGRKAETDRLRAALGRTTRDGRQVVLVGGEAGIGKTALLADFAREAHASGTGVLYGRCDEELGRAYQPFAEALDHYVGNCPLSELSAHVAAHGGELSRITPQLLRRLPEAPLPARTGSEGDRYRLFEAVSGLLDQASRGSGLVLVLDDLHWAAPPTLSLLRHIVRSRTSTLLVVATYRQTEVEPDHPLAATLADLWREPGVERLTLHGLDEPGVSAFVERFEGLAADAGADALSRALHARTGGNPFFVGEFLRHLGETGAAYGREGAWTYYDDVDELGLPEGVRDVVARRLSRLSAGANRVLTIASVIGLEFDIHLLESMGPATGAAPMSDAAGADAVLDSLDVAVAAHVVTELGFGRYQFAHALVRDTVYASLTATRRARLHHRVGDALASLPGDAESRLPALAHHFAEAATDGTARQAGDYALAAAREAFDRAAWDDAIAFVTVGLGVLSTTDPAQLERRFDLLLLEIETQLVVVRIPLAVDAMHRAIEAARLLGSAERLARAVSLYLLSEGGADLQAIELAEEALQGLGDSEPALRARVLAGLAASVPHRHSGCSDAETEAALALARASGQEDAVHAALVARRTFLSDSPRAQEWLAVEEELAEIGPPSGPVAGTRWIHSVGRGWAIAHLTLGDRTAFESDVASVERWRVELRNNGLGAQLAFWRAAVALLDGRFGDVQRHAEASMALAPHHDDLRATQICRLALDRGRSDEARGEALRVLAMRPRHNLLWSMAAVAHAEGGERDEARTIVDQLAADDFMRVTASTTLAYLAEVIAGLADMGRAARLYERYLPYAGLAVVSGLAGHCPGAADRYLGQLAETLGRWDDAQSHYEAALVVEAGLRSPPLLARTRYSYGHMLLERGRPGDLGRATELLASSLDTALQLGMARLAARASELL